MNDKNKMRALIVATTPYMIRQFLMKDIILLNDMGYKVDVAINFKSFGVIDEEQLNSFKIELVKYGVDIFNISFSRSPLSKDNFKACKELKELIENGNYDVVHCHTPNAAAVTRLVCRKFRKKGLKVIYTAHGFHFFKGAPLKNWLLFYPVEWLCAHWTDILITINKEDYALAQKHMHAKKVVYIPGVGLDTEKFKNCEVDRDKKREELGIPDDKIWCIAIGELSKRKNHEVLIRAIKDISNIYLTIVGKGELKEYLVNLSIELNLEDRVKFLGFRTDIDELCHSSDIYLFPSFQEGLPVALMEAMASGLPCVVSKIRGNTDLIDENGGAFFDPHSVDDCKNAIETVLSKDLNKLGNYNQEKINQFDKITVIEEMKKIYYEIGEK